MSYTPTEWASGDIVTSEKLNKLEQGVAGGGVLVVGATGEDEIALDKTWKQIYDADFAVIVIEDDGKYYHQISDIYEDDGNYIVRTPSSMTFIANSENGYPTTGTP